MKLFADRCATATALIGAVPAGTALHEQAGVRRVYRPGGEAYPVGDLPVLRTIERGAAQVEPRLISLDLVGCDRIGIVRDISSALARRGVGIHELETEVESASMSGEQLFRVHAEVLQPDDTVLAALREDLEAIADELMVDLTVESR